MLRLLRFLALVLLLLVLLLLLFRLIRILLLLGSLRLLFLGLVRVLRPGLLALLLILIWRLALLVLLLLLLFLLFLLLLDLVEDVLDRQPGHFDIARGLFVLRVDVQHAPPVGNAGLHVLQSLVQIGIALLGASLEEAVAEVVLGLGDQRHVLAPGGDLLIQIDRLAQIIEAIIAVGLVELGHERLRLLDLGLVVLVDCLGVLAVGVEPIALPDHLPHRLGPRRPRRRQHQQRDHNRIKPLSCVH